MKLLSNLRYCVFCSLNPESSLLSSDSSLVAGLKRQGHHMKDHDQTRIKTLLNDHKVCFKMFILFKLQCWTEVPYKNMGNQSGI